MNPDLFFENFELLADAPNGIQKLRELILQLAVMGKLVEQDPNDEPASVLLEKINVEKKKVVRGNSKKSSLLTLSSADIPYEIPSSWIWTQLINVYDVRDGTHDSPRYLTAGFPLVTSKNLSNGYLNLTNVNCISEIDHIKISERSKVDRDDILFAMIGSIGNPVIVDVDIEFSIKNVALFKYYSKDLSVPRYLKFFLEIASHNMRKQANGGVQSFVSLGYLRKYPFPFPPLVEQKRIVAKIDELMTFCDELEAHRQKKQELQSKLNSAALDRMLSAENQEEFEQNWQRICENFDFLYDNPENVDKLKQAILQLAVQGKLVEQNPEDEPASFLIEKIENERKNLIKEGKIRETKSIQSIDLEEMPFTLPENWVWCRIEQIADVRIGSTPSRKESSYWDGNIPWVSSGEVANCRISKTKEHITASGLKNSSTKVYPKETVLIAMIGQGKTRGQAAILDIEACTNQNVAGLIFNAGNIYPEYVWRWALSEYEKTRSGGRGGAQPALNGNKVRELLIPIPPLAEQKRIVEKVEQLMSLCDELEAKLRKEREDSEKLMEAVVKGLLESAVAGKSKSDKLTLVQAAVIQLK